MADVNDIPDAELLGRVVRSLRAKADYPRWTAISHAFALGSTYSAQLCRRFGVDPNEVRPKRKRVKQGA